MRNPESKFFFAEMENNHKRENVDNKRLGRQIESICKAIGMESVKSSYDQRRTYVKILDSIALPTALRKILMGHELDKLENAYMKSIELSIAEARAYIDPGFKKFFGVNNISKLKEA